MKTTQDNNNYSTKSFTFMIIGIVAMIVIVLLTGTIFTKVMKARISIEADDILSFDQHYVFIVDDKESAFWSEVLEAAKEQANEDHTYIEDFHESLGVNYTNEDLLRVAVNSRVDGIIYGGNNTEGTEALINKAVESGIGVVVLQNDIDTSMRQCFVGVNNYELGHIYGSQLLEMINANNEIKKVEIIVEESMSEAVSTLISLAIEDTLSETIDPELIPELEFRRIQATDTFSVEEDIRNIFMSEEKLPDVMICLNSIYTQCVYQALVDYNRVGEVQVIGYYANEAILDAVDKQVIYSTISVDTTEMGQASVQALNEYCQVGYTNSFMPVSMQVYNQEKAHEELVERESRDEH